MREYQRLGRVRSCISGFADDESGNATLWSLTWLLGFALMAGLAIDSTNGWRNKTMLQSTADAAALAGAMDIPNPLREIPYDPSPGAYSDLKANVRLYAEKNMPQGRFGTYLRATADETDERNDVHLGHWDGRRFTPAIKFSTPTERPLNGIRVRAGQTHERNNPVATALLHMIGRDGWDVRVEAVAMRGHDTCYDHSFMSRQKICQMTNSSWSTGYCLYGDGGLFLRPGNTWAEGAGGVTPTDAPNNIDEDNYENGFSLRRDDSLGVPMVDRIPEIANLVLRGGSMYAQPKFLSVGEGVVRLEIDSIGSNADLDESFLDADARIQVASLGGFGSIMGLIAAASSGPGHGGGAGASDDAGRGGGGFGCPQARSPGSQVDPIPEEFDLTEGVTFASGVQLDPMLPKGRIYYHEGSGPITIDGHLQNVTIVSWGKFDIRRGSVLEDVTLITLDTSPGTDGISMNGSVQLGDTLDDCDPEGGVKLYAMGSITGSAKAQFNGALLVSGGSIGFAAQADGAQGVTAYAAGNVFLTSGNTFSACGVPVTLPDEVFEAALVR